MSVKQMADAFDSHMNWFTQTLGDEVDQTIELGRQLQAASQERIAMLQQRSRSLSEIIQDMEAEKAAVEAEIENEKRQATAAAAEIEARRTALNAILAGEPEQSEQVAA